jgi:hypothetical protein
MDFGDSGPRGFSVLNIENNEIEFVKNNVSPVHIKVSLADVKNDNIELNKKLVESNFIKIIVDTDYKPEEVEQLIKTVNSVKPNSLTIDYKFNTAVQKIVSDVDFASVDIADAIKEFINKLEIENKKSIIDYTLELYQKSK